MGEHLNSSADALAFVDTLDALIDPILENTCSLDYVQKPPLFRRPPNPGKGSVF
jgi:hypothetical protein